MPSSFINDPAHTVVVLDFETSGLSPSYGDRAIEVGAVKIVNGVIIERFQQLMNPGFRISAFIESHTGISNAMLRKAPPCHEVMSEFAKFIKGYNLVAHNASFDKKFLDAEFSVIDQHYVGSFACSMLLARRLLPNANNHQLATLMTYLGLNSGKQYHRALNDAEMTGSLWLSLLEKVLSASHLRHIPFELTQTLSKLHKDKVSKHLQSLK